MRYEIILVYSDSTHTIYVLGIGLFTYHKYRKSLESTIPLDAHGNPIITDGMTGTADGQHGQQVELDETSRLTRVSDDFDGVRSSLCDVCTI